MAEIPAGGTRRIVVAVDVTLGWNLARGGGYSEGATCVYCQPGGAALLGTVITAVAEELPVGTGGRIEVSAPETPQAVPPMDERFHHRHAIWTRHSEHGRQAWRVADFLGVDRAPSGEGATPPEDELERADLIVLHDVGLGFQDRPDGWPRPACSPASGWPSAAPASRAGKPRMRAWG